jgi:hypothetical protein
VAIAFVNSSSSGTTSVTGVQSMTKPTGSDGTNIIICMAFAGRAATTALGSWTAGTGWTEIGTQLIQTNATGTSSSGNQMFWALGSVADVSLTPVGNVNFGAWALATFSGVDLTTPVDAQGTANSNTASATLAANAVTVVTDQAWEVIGHSNWNVTTTPTISGFTVLANYINRLSYNTTPKSVGSTGTATITESNGAGSQVLTARPIALRPASAGASASDAGFGARVRNLQVGPVAQWFGKRSTLPVDLTQAPVTDTNFGGRVRVPNNRVGPMALRMLYRAPAFPFDSTVSTVTANRRRRLICAGA